MKKKRIKAALCSVMAIILIFGFSANTFAVTKAIHMNFNGQSGMGAILQPGQMNVPSNRASFTVSGFPTTATINWIEIAIGPASNVAGAMLITELVLSRDGVDARQSWNGTSGTKVRFNQFNGQSCNGRFDIWFTCSYIAGYYIGPTLIAQATRSYNTATMILDYS